MRSIAFLSGTVGWKKGKYIFQRNLQGKIEMTKEHFRWLLASDKYSYRDAAIPHVYSDRNERCFQHEVEHRFRSYSNTDSGAARTVA